MVYVKNSLAAQFPRVTIYAQFAACINQKHRRRGPPHLSLAVLLLALHLSLHHSSARAVATSLWTLSSQIIIHSEAKIAWRTRVHWLAGRCGGWQAMVARLKFDCRVMKRCEQQV